MKPVTGTSAGSRVSEGPTGRTIFWRIVLLSLGVRVALEIIGLVSAGVHGHSVVSEALNLWNRWDAPHYLRVAEVGYRPAGTPGDDKLFIVFFPFFPLAVRVVATVVRNFVLSGLIVSLGASIGASWLLYRLVRIDADHAEAWRAVLLLVSFPTAYFLAAPYSEALFLFAVLASVYAARRGGWARAGLAGALATGTRVAGIALIPALAVETLSTPGKTADWFRRLAWVAVVGGGIIAYLAINEIVYHDPLWFLRVQRSHWFQYAVPPWRPLVDAVHTLGRGTYNTTRTFIMSGRLASFAFTVPLLIVAVRRLRPADAVYGWAGFVLVLSTNWLISLPRYVLALYPIFMVGARLTASKRIFWPVVVLGAAAQGAFFWRYAFGGWTF